MKRSLNVGVILTLLLAVTVLAAGVAPVFASTTYHEYLSASGAAVIDLPNHQPKMELLCQHFESSSDHGPGNNLFFMLWTKNGFAPVGILTTSPERVAFLPVLWAGFPAASNLIFVNPCNLQVLRIDKIVMVCWSVPIKGTITGNVPGTPIPWSTALGVSSFELPPGSLILRGYGDATTSTTVIGPLPSGYTLTTVGTQYNAHGTFICPSWHYFGPVADTPTLSTHSVLTNVHP